MGPAILAGRVHRTFRKNAGMTFETVSANKAFGGTQGVYRHNSAETGTDMTFGVYVPPQAAQGPVPVLWYLSGLTCTHVNVTEKAGAQRISTELDGNGSGQGKRG